MRFLNNILAKAGLIVDGTTQLNTIANATIDTDKFLVSDGGVIKYRTGAQLGSDIGAANLAASTLKHQVKLGEAINKGQAVYVSSADGTNMIVSKASNASEATSSKTLGLIETSGVLNDQVNVVTEGLLAGLDTSTAAAGDPVWLGTGGNLIFGLANKPYAPAHLVFIGIVTRVQQNNGEIFVKVQNGFELKEIHDVQITTTPSDNTVLAYESATSLYKMKSIATLLGYTPANAARQLTINGTTYDLTADRTWNVGTVTSVGVSVPTGLSVSGTPVTGSGTIAIALASGYSIPTTASQANWDTAYANRITSLTTTGTSGAATLTSNTLNIPIYQAQGNYITSLTGEATASGPGAASVTLTNSAVIGKVLTGLNVTGGTIVATDSILTAFGKVQNQINGLMGGVVYQGTWNASTNSPTLTSSSGTKGYYYIVTTAGSTNLDGITDWKVGDWAIFNGSTWNKVDNTDAVVSVNGQTGAVSLTTSNISEGTNLYYTDARARAAISLTTTGSSGAATYVGGVLNVPQYTLGGLGGVPTSRQLTINGTAYDLSADRSWSVGTVTSVAATAGSGISISGSPITSSGTLTITNTGVLSINGSTGAVTGIITTSNYNSYSPTLTGGGASGTWGINITGNAGYASSAGNADTVDGYHAAQTYTSTGNAAGSFLGGHYSSGGTEKPNSATFGAGKLKIAMLSSSNLGFGGSWNDVIWVSAYSGGDVKSSHALVFDKYSSNVWVSDQNFDSASWGTGYLLLHSGNYNSYAPTLTGGGASGTWGINITGSAGSASTASQVTINYNNDSNSTYQMLWGSGNSVYGTAGVYVNPSSDTIYAAAYRGNANVAGTGEATYHPAGIYSTGTNWLYGTMYLNNNTIWDAGNIYNNGWFRNIGQTGLYNQTYDNHIASYDASYWRIASANGIQIYDKGIVNLKGYIYFDSSGFGLLNNQGGWSVLAYQGSSYGGELRGAWTATGDMRAPIFYDSQDTGYYLDPNSESKLRKIWINNGGASGVSWSTGLNMGDSTNYWNLIQDAGVARQRNFGTGGYDWYNNTGGTQLMVLSNAGNLIVSSSMRAPIFYDSQDTSYYGDFASTSRMAYVTMNQSTGAHNHMTYGGYFSGGDWQTLTNTEGQLNIVQVNNINGGGYSNQPPNVYTYGGVLSWRTVNHSFQLYASHTGDITFKTQWNNDNYSGWRRILHESNYSSWAIARGGDTVDGIINYRTNLGAYSGSLSNARLQIYNDNNQSAFMSFHRSGQYAVNFGLDQDNVLRIGGWSAAADRWVLDMSGNNTVAGSFRAPIFYDSNDTSYYLDPNGTSVLNTIDSSTRARWGEPRIWTNRQAYTSDQGYWTGTNGWGTSEGNWDNAWKGGFSGWDIWGSGTAHPQGSGYIHAQGIVSGQHYANSDGSSAYGWMMVGSHNATDNRYWLRGKWASSTSGWVEMITTGNIGSQSVNYASSAGNADTVDGYHVSTSGSANTIPTRNSSGYLAPENWIQLNGSYGLYSPTNNAHFKVNDGSRGPWKIIGSRNGWNGLEFDCSNGPISLMILTDGSTSGFYNETYGWQTRWNNGNLYVGKGAYGGSEATVLDTTNSFYAANMDQYVRTTDTVQHAYFGVNGLPFASYRFYVNGDSYFGGNIYASGNVTAYSDARVKKNIRSIDNALNRVIRARGVMYDRSDINSVDNIGFIAQELEGQFPELVSTDQEGKKGVMYQNMVAVLLEAIKEQQKQIEELKAKLV